MLSQLANLKTSIGKAVGVTTILEGNGIAPHSLNI